MIMYIFSLISKTTWLFKVLCGQLIFIALFLVFTYTVLFLLSFLMIFIALHALYYWNSFWYWYYYSVSNSDNRRTKYLHHLEQAERDAKTIKDFKHAVVHTDLVARDYFKLIGFIIELVDWSALWQDAKRSFPLVKSYSLRFLGKVFVLTCKCVELIVKCLSGLVLLYVYTCERKDTIQTTVAVTLSILGSIFTTALNYVGYIIVKLISQLNDESPPLLQSNNECPPLLQPSHVLRGSQQGQNQRRRSIAGAGTWSVKEFCEKFFSGH
jgi:hypothetical protein